MVFPQFHRRGTGVSIKLRDKMLLEMAQFLGLLTAICIALEVGYDLPPGFTVQISQQLPVIQLWRKCAVYSQFNIS
jgi:hypothetical protein